MYTKQRLHGSAIAQKSLLRRNQEKFGVAIVQTLKSDNVDDRTKETWIKELLAENMQDQ